MSNSYTGSAPNAPEAIGPYSLAVSSGSLVFLSGQIPVDPKTKEIVSGGIEAQTNQVLANIKAILEHLGLGFGNVCKATVFLTDLGHFAVMNGIYEKWLGGAKPARSTIQVAALPKGSLVEIEMTATR